MLRDTSPTQGSHRHARRRRATDTAGHTQKERSNKPGAHCNRLAAHAARLPQVPHRVEQEGDRARRGNSSIRHARREGRLDGTPRGTVRRRGTEKVAAEGRRSRTPGGDRRRHTRAEKEEVLDVPPVVLNRTGSTELLRHCGATEYTRAWQR